MKNYVVLFTTLFLFITVGANALAFEKKLPDQIEIIKGEVDKPYQRVGFVWEYHKKSDKAMKRIKKSALKLNADAVIHFNVMAPVVMGMAVKWVSNKEEAEKFKTHEEIPVIFGKSNRSYVELVPIWKSHKKINKAFNKLVKAAKKKGADAIIDFQIGSYTGTSAIVSSTGIVSSVNYTIPTLQGVAIKWK